MTSFFQNLRRIVAIALAVIGMATAALAGATASAKLDRFHVNLMQRYGDVRHLSTDELAAMNPEDVVLFDVRDQSEYDVSRIDGAIRVSPSISAPDFLDDHADALRGKTAVFYCSVGERSSRLAQRVMSSAPEAGAVYNLAGGLFKWHNEYKNVVAKQGETSAIHPFNRKWGRLIERQDAIRMKPESGS